MRITFLGNGDSMGTPRVYCDCKVCQEARTTGDNRRLRSSLWIESEGQRPMLLDCGPDWRAQMEMRGERQVTQALLTHAHFDHIGGLTDWADACRWRDETARLFAPEEVLDEIRTRFPWIERQMTMIDNEKGTSYGKWLITPWKVNHGKNGYSYAYHFENRDKGIKWAYCSDAINLSEQQKAPLHGLTLLVLGTSYVQEVFPMDTRSVYDMREGVQLAEQVKPGSVIFTHLSHDVDVNQEYSLPSHVRLATTGLQVSL
jgi:phosphoribosyl 1,2-cyclic phosphate phosphodiesterase